MEQALVATPEADGAASRYRLVDCDVHAYCRRSLRDIAPYLPAAWRRRFEVKGLDLNFDSLTYRFTNIHKGHGLRPDAAPSDGGVPGSDPAFLAEDLLDRYGIECAILNNLEALGLACVQAGPDESVVLCRAFNDWLLETWLPVDDRFRLGIVVPAQDPVAAAEEIRRMGSDPRVVAVYVPTLGLGLGNNFYSPIYDAAVELGLPVVVHPTSCEFMYQGTTLNPAGYPENYCEFYADLPIVPWTHMCSLVFSGAFERFPGLRVAFVEMGFSFVAAALWRMDKAWEGNRFEVPWVKRRPSEYVREHVRFTTQPVDEPADRRELEQTVAALGDSMLLFSTDYPHWDGDEPGKVFQSLSEESRRRIYSANATEFFPLARSA